ncbi:MAG: hypothetical protein A3C61_00780 [Candidatus Yanofskybacteria bacterium RIFCSPHIGHO2_02_FULL_39_10]|uniref:DOD-type homing endonuclease domain-containing protein n=1 Tax=Candidatus Yanofskybacteria bacterium RIFCSPHIGHO2_02_FULL_39_10 TaxID=1802674 RepID=A0A1F8F8A5_9BACT|nr:MAG: hypothetical protein A3C61_00780 [Candidatus Yanofskybacteria bacterium RIFCSPHIGHO2_02_FULL_39_10]
MKKVKAIKKKPDIINQYTGESWVYTKLVKEHFFKPQNLLLNNPDKSDYDSEGIIGSPACILSDSRLHSRPNVVPISELGVGDKVLSHDGKYNNISKVYRPQYKGKLVKIKTQLGEIYATADHLIYGTKIDRPKSFFLSSQNKRRRSMTGWQHAGEFSKGDMCLYPVLKGLKSQEYLEIDSHKIKFDHNSRSLPNRIKIDHDFLELAGYFIAEGYTKENSADVGFIFSNDEMEYAERVRDIIKRVFNLKVSIKERKVNHRLDVTVYNIHLARLFRKLFGHSAISKHIPNFMITLPCKLQTSLILGLWRGDGYINIGRKWPRAGYVSISYELVQQIKLILLRLEIIPSIYTEKEKTMRGVSHQKSYRIHVGDLSSLEKLSNILKIEFQTKSRRKAQHTWFDDNYVHIPIKAVSFENFDGRLANLEVDKTHTYLTDAFLAHNCGDVMRVWLKIDPKGDKITDFKWRTFGCASAIAATSMLSVMVTERGGMKIDKALQIKPQHITARLGGLPNRKIHCSVLGDKALRTAVNNWFKKTEQFDRIIVEGAKIIDPNTKVTEADIEEAVLEGAITLEEVQKRTKVGIGYPDCIPQVEQLIRFYREKYFGPDKT